MNDQPAKPQELVQSFQDYFVVRFAHTPALKKWAYQVRYRVYCDEFRYEAIEKYPDGLEKDEYDDFSLHCLVWHKKTQQAAGCVRLVPAWNGDSPVILPFEKHCPESIDSQCLQSINPDRQKVCEISRLAVDRLFRRRSGEELTRFGDISAFDFSEKEQRTFSLIAVSAFLAATALIELSGRTEVFAMMEPFLPRMLKRSGLIFQKAGFDVNYRGIRAPYFIRDPHAVFAGESNLTELYLWIRQQVAEDFSEVMRV